MIDVKILNIAFCKRKLIRIKTRTTLSILMLLLFSCKVYSTGQIPDYLIYGPDTIPIFNNPLEQYFDLVKNRDLIDFKNPCWSTACWRGYKAFWELKNDSLFLLKITSCVRKCDEAKDANLFAMFGKNKPFAYWYKGTITTPYGKLFSGADMGYNAIYEFENKIQIESGVVKKQWQTSNIEFIEQIKLDSKLNSQIPDLKDTLLFYLSKNLNWKKLDNSYCYCWDSYVLSYDKCGQITEVELIKNQNDSTSIWDKLYDWRFDKKCSKKIKSALEPLSLSYLNSHKDFKIEIDLFYDERLEMWECRPYNLTFSYKQIEDYVRKQMDIKE